jgi:hypothetical protein
MLEDHQRIGDVYIWARRLRFPMLHAIETEEILTAWKVGLKRRNRYRAIGKRLVAERLSIAPKTLDSRIRQTRK